jgi:hypothetical protein
MNRKISKSFTRYNRLFVIGFVVGSTITLSSIFLSSSFSSLAFIIGLPVALVCGLLRWPGLMW